MKRKLTPDEVVAWFNAASYEERVEFVDALVEMVGGKEEAYWIMVDAAGGEEELQQLSDMALYRASLS